MTSNCRMKTVWCVVLFFIEPGESQQSWMTDSALREMVQRMEIEFKTEELLKPQKEDVNMTELENVTLNVLVHEMMPYTKFIRNNDEDHVTGYIGEIWDDLKINLGFRCTYRNVSFEEGKEILTRGNADIMLSPVILTSDDLEYFDAIGPVANTVYTLFVRTMDDEGSSASYLWTWSSGLWLAYLGMLILCTLLLYISSKLRWRYGLNKELKKERVKNKDHAIETMDCLSLGKCIFIILGYATQQDLQVGSKAGSLRLLLAVLLISNSLMVTSYTTMLMSRLTVGDKRFYFNSLEAIPHSQFPFVCVRTNSAVISTFQINSSSRELHPTWKRVVNQGPCHPNPLTTADVAANICKKNCVLFESDNIMSTLLARDRGCDMLRLPVKKVFSQISIILRKGFRHKSLLKFEIMKMKSSGAQQLIEDRFLKVKGNLPGIPGYQEVTIGHVKDLLGIYGIAVVVSLGVLILEIISNHKIWERKHH